MTTKPEITAAIARSTDTAEALAALEAAHAHHRTLQEPVAADYFRLAELGEQAWAAGASLPERDAARARGGSQAPMPGSAVAVQGPDGHSYLALGPEPGQRGWFKTFAEADEVAPTVVQRCMRRGPRYGSEWTVKTPAP